jgi:hypothetical protein
MRPNRPHLPLSMAAAGCAQIVIETSNIWTGAAFCIYGFKTEPKDNEYKSKTTGKHHSGGVM